MLYIIIFERKHGLNMVLITILWLDSLNLIAEVVQGVDEKA